MPLSERSIPTPLTRVQPKRQACWVLTIGFLQAVHFHFVVLRRLFLPMPEGTLCPRSRGQVLAGSPVKPLARLYSQTSCIIIKARMDRAPPLVTTYLKETFSIKSKKEKLQCCRISYEVNAGPHSLVFDARLNYKTAILRQFLKAVQL